MVPRLQDAAGWAALARTAVAPVGRWARLDVVEATGSTNADLAALAAAGPDTTPDRTVLVAHRQDAGRGRRERVWEAAPAQGLTFSVLLRPREVPLEHWGWAPLLAGLALVLAFDDYRPAADPVPVPVALKWPNDLLLGPDARKGAGILAEVVDGGPGPDGKPSQALVVGIGINVGTPEAELPAGGTSLLAQSVRRSRPDVLGDVLATLGSLEEDWRAVRGDADRAGFLHAYRVRCATLGTDVRVALPGGAELVGRAEDVDEAGRLLVRESGGARDGALTTVSAGDVVHVRPTG